MLSYKRDRERKLEKDRIEEEKGKTELLHLL